ncbi:MAG: GLPGLI family protein [Cyclobacteriaceae bacterium]|nr:GLPGLI family protein [Cyclobacteriaceae bacterium]
MKRMLLIVGFLVSIATVQVVFGQVAEGVITYEVKINMHRRIPAERAQMKQMIPEFRTTKQQLFFKADESIYKPLIEDEDEATSATVSGGGMRMTMRNPNTEIYLSQATNIMLTKQEFMGKEYLVTDTVKVSPWKFGTGTKTIAGYECKQAYYTDETQPSGKQEITAWYTDKIRPFLGPERFNTLPGAILALDINNEERVFIAKSVEVKELKKNDLKAPTSGTKISRVEFRAIMEEQMKKMGGNNTFIIR